jgi:RHS repeat-associated protein
LEAPPLYSYLVKYYFAGPRLLAHRDGGGNLLYHHQDRLGSTRLVTNQSGAVVVGGVYAYDAFGATRAGNASVSDHVEFTGQRQDSDLPDSVGVQGGGGGLLYYGARYYDSVLGRFISADSLIPDAYSPQALNRYSYVENAPTVRVDPSGHESEVFYSGKLNLLQAAYFARENGYPMIQGTSAGMALSVLDLLDPSGGTTAVPWLIVSHQYAAHASGDVHVFADPLTGANPLGVFYGLELPTLLGNGDVNSIAFHGYLASGTISRDPDGEWQGDTRFTQGLLDVYRALGKAADAVGGAVDGLLPAPGVPVNPTALASAGGQGAADGNVYDPVPDANQSVDNGTGNNGTGSDDVTAQVPISQPQ